MNDDRFLHALDRLVAQGGADPGEKDLYLTAERVGGRSLAPATDGYCALASTFRGAELVRATPVPALVRGGRFPGGALLQTRPADVIVTVLVREAHLDRLLLGLAAPHAATLRNHLFRYGTDTGTWKVSDRRDRELCTDILRLMVVTYVEAAEDWQTTLDALVVAYLSQMVPRTPAAGPQSPEHAVELVRAAVAAHPEDVTLAGLAGLLSLNASYLSTLVRERCGKTFSVLVREARMERAAELLRGTDLPVTEVAQRVGYAGTSRFHRLFRGRFGCTPAAWRRSEREGCAPDGSD